MHAPALCTCNRFYRCPESAVLYTSIANSNAAIFQSGPEIPQSMHARDGQASKRPSGVPHFLGTDLGAGHADHDVRDAFERPSGLP